MLERKGGSSMKFRPMGSGVVIERHEAKDKTEGGLYIPEQAKKQPHKGTVMAIGPKVVDLVVGDVVMFSPYSGSSIVLDGKDYLLIGDINLLGVLEED
jgi:chaperonin GroES